MFRVRELCYTFQKYQNLDTWVSPGFVQELWPWASCLTILALLASSGRWELLFEPIISEICGVPCSLDQLLSLRIPWLRTPSPAIQAWEHHLVIQICKIFFHFLGPTNPVYNSRWDLQDCFFVFQFLVCFVVVVVVIFTPNSLKLLLSCCKYVHFLGKREHSFHHKVFSPPSPQSKFLRL